MKVKFSSDLKNNSMALNKEADVIVHGNSMTLKQEADVIVHG